MLSLWEENLFLFPLFRFPFISLPRYLPPSSLACSIARSFSLSSLCLSLWTICQQNECCKHLPSCSKCASQVYSSAWYINRSADWRSNDFHEIVGHQSSVIRNYVEYEEKFCTCFKDVPRQTLLCVNTTRSPELGYSTPLVKYEDILRTCFKDIPRQSPCYV